MTFRIKLGAVALTSVLALGLVAVQAKAETTLIIVSWGGAYSAISHI